MRGKQGQFYFLAAMIIIIILIGFIAVINSSSKKESVDLESLEKELNIEIEKVLEYIVHEDLTNFEAEENLANFSLIYVDKIERSNKDILFIFGRSDHGLRCVGYKIDDSEELNITSGENIIKIKNGGNFDETLEDFPEDPIMVDYGDSEYSFELRKGQNFYYMISKQYEGEKQIIVG